jgi:hypothetical protein
MERTERGYFDMDPSISGGESHENLYAMDPALFTPSAFINVNPNTNEDLNNILGGGSFMPGFDYGSAMDTGYYAWNPHNQGTTYSPYPNLSVDQQPYRVGLSSGPIANGFEERLPKHNGVELQAIPYSDFQTSSQIDSQEAKTPTATTSRNNKPAKSAAKKNSDATAAATDEAPKVKKTRGRRKTKEKSAEEKRAKEERKLERNRMAASKCRQKKKLATEEMMENFNELERQNHFMKACLEEVKQDRNNALALLLEHKGCSHLAVDKCLESHLERIAGEFDDSQQSDTTMTGTYSVEGQTDTDAKQFLNSIPSSPSDIQSRRNSTSLDSIAMSRSGSDVSPHASPRGSTSHSVRPQNSHTPQAWNQKFPSEYQSWQEQFSMPQVYQGSRLDSKISKQDSARSTSSSSPGDSMSRQNSSRTSVFEERGGSQPNDSGISNVDTPPEERKKNLADGPEDEAISLIAQEKNAFKSRTPHMMPNQRLFGNLKIHSGVQP